MVASFMHRFSRGLQFQLNYTWSHSLDNIAEQFGSGGGGLQSSKDFASAKGNSNFDLRHRFVTAAVGKYLSARAGAC